MALADRVVDPRRASFGYAAVLLVFAASVQPLVHVIYETLDLVPRVVPVLRQHQDPEAPPAAMDTPPRPLVVLLLDGLRLDEAERSPALSALRDRGASAVVELEDFPTLSRPYYHALLTGVPPRGSGVRRNRQGQRQVFDALPDRVRRAGGTVSFVAEDNDWMAVLFAAEGDGDAHGPDALDGPLTELLAEIGRGAAPTLSVIHVLSVDGSAHDHGVDSDAHRRALALAERVTNEVVEATFGRTLLAVVSDHGHIGPGGHGGDEPEVRRVPFILVGDGVPHARVDRALAVEELAPTFASWMGVPPPRAAVAPPAPEVAGAFVVDPAPASRRGALLTEATSLEAKARRRRLGWLLPLVSLLVLMGLGATKRSFGGFDIGSLLAPLLVFGGVLVVHSVVLGRPFTLSAMDNATRQGIRSAVSGALLALVAIPAAAAAARARAGGGFRDHLRRAAGAVGWASVAATALTVAVVGGTLGPWAPTAIGVYAPILAFTGSGGAAVAAGLILIASALTRSPTEAPTPVDQSAAL
ncbi:MAG: hypothetical protein DRJ42_04085 [Deltaproteobacteria bacterium]|nr:MAG: hypothetical protein DRJ42_04085 [Deltaproteobacteria bacterium]